MEDEALERLDVTGAVALGDAGVDGVPHGVQAGHDLACPDAGTPFQNVHGKALYLPEIP